MSNFKTFFNKNKKDFLNLILTDNSFSNSDWAEYFGSNMYDSNEDTNMLFSELYSHNNSLDYINEIKSEFVDWFDFEVEDFKKEIDNIKQNIEDDNKVEEFIKGASEFFINYNYRNVGDDSYSQETLFDISVSDTWYLEDYPKEIKNYCDNKWYNLEDNLPLVLEKGQISYKVAQSYIEDLEDLEFLTEEQFTNLARSLDIYRSSSHPNYKIETISNGLLLYNKTSSSIKRNIIEDNISNFYLDSVNSLFLKCDIAQLKIEKDVNELKNNRISYDDAKCYIDNNEFTANISLVKGNISLENMSFDGLIIDGNIINESEISSDKEVWISDRNFGDNKMAKNWFYNTVNKYLKGN